MSKNFKPFGDRFVIRNALLVNGVWKADIRDKETGKLKRVNSRETKRPKAELFFYRWCEDQIKRERKDTYQALLFEQAFPEWLALKSASPTTIKQHELSYNKYFAGLFGKSLVSSVTPLDIEKFLKALETAGRSTRTRQWYLTTLRGFFRWAVRHRYRIDDPTEGIRIPKGLRRRGKVMSHPEARQLLEASKQEFPVEISAYRNIGGNKKENAKLSTYKVDFKQRMKAPAHLFLALLIALHTGLRRRNVLRLRWSQLDLAKRKISIAGHEMKAKESLEIPIHPELAQVLEEEKRKAEHSAVLGEVFKTLTTSFQRLQKRIAVFDAEGHKQFPFLDEEGKPKFRWHDLRHTVSTWLAIRYPQAIKDAMLAHTARTVSQIYTHVQFEDLQKAIDAMPRLLGKADGDQSHGESEIPKSAV